MKKVYLILSMLVMVLGLAACAACEKEPIIEQNHKLIVPPDFGRQPK